MIQAGHRVLASGEKDGGHSLQVLRPLQRHHLHSFLVNQRIELVEVRCVGIKHQRDPRSALLPLRPMEERVLLRQQVAPVRDHRHGGDAGACLQPFARVEQQLRVAAKLVQDEAAEELAVRRIDRLPGSEQVREGAAAIHVGDQVAGRACASGDREVDEIVPHQVRLRRAAGSLQDDPLEIPEQ